MEDITICFRTRRHRIPFEKCFKIQGYSFNQAGKTQDCAEERKQKCEQILVERREDLPKQRGEMQENGGACLQCILFWKWKLVLEPSQYWRELKDGKKVNEAFVQILKKEDENITGYCRMAGAARTMWTKMKHPSLSEMIVESMWRAVVTTLKKACKWRSTKSRDKLQMQLE